MTEAAKILEARTFAVAGASSQKHKYGYKVFKALIDGGFDAYAINPNVPVIDGQQSYASIHKLPVKIEALSVVTPPAATRLIVADAINAGIASFGCSLVQRTNRLSMLQKLQALP